jgi:SWIM zinc finger
MIKKYKLENNPHLNLIFDNHDEWIPAYFHGTFCGGMSTTQRSESINVIIKIWMGSNTSLYNFAKKFEKMTEAIYERESDEDIRSMNETSKIWSCDPIETEAQRLYTRSIFSIFKEKLRRCTAYRVHEVKKDIIYEARLANSQSKYEWYDSRCMVVVDKEHARVDCECKGFEFEGILCSHAIEIM